jgi:hypothetical protein
MRHLTESIPEDRPREVPNHSYADPIMADTCVTVSDTFTAVSDTCAAGADTCVTVAAHA